MTSIFSWQNSLRFCPASVCTPRPNLLVILVLLDFLLLLSSPLWWKEHLFFFLVLVLEVLVYLHRHFSFSFFGISGFDIDLDCYDFEWFAVETNQDHSIIFEIAPKYCILDSFVDYESYSISSMGFLSIVVDTMVIWIKFSRSLIPKMLMFILAISCLNMSNLPWFMDMIF